MAGKRSRPSTNKFKPAEDEIKGESESEGEADHVGGAEAEEEPAARRGGKAPKVEAKVASSSSAKEGEAFKNKQRVLIIASRGIVHRFRHLMMDVAKLLPHSSKDAKMESKDRPMVINEICEMKGCNNALYFETRKHKDLYMWVAKTPLGPSAKFLVQNIHTMGELKFTGNHLMGSRPFIVFDAAFDSEPHLQLIKEMFSHTFGTPKGHRRSKPFVDHTISFYVSFLPLPPLHSPLTPPPHANPHPTHSSPPQTIAHSPPPPHCCASAGPGRAHLGSQLPDHEEGGLLRACPCRGWSSLLLATPPHLRWSLP